MSKRPLFVGLISGTSVDGVDAALVEIGNDIKLRAAHEEVIPSRLRNQALAANANNRLRETLELDVMFGRLFAKAALNLLAEAGVSPDEVQAIGSHGQTISHAPGGEHPFTFQIGDPNLIAELTGITTIADFRRRDVAAGGQGAPLAPIFHEAVFKNPSGPRIVVNIGGIANLTLIESRQDTETVGFDTGPGNGLLDAWAQQHLGEPFDRDGQWGSTGTVHERLLATLRAEPYFALAPPKSTGKEYFNGDWLGRHLDRVMGLISPADTQRTLVELTASTIADAITSNAPGAHELLLCGGGAANPLLRERLRARLPGVSVISTAERGVDPDYLEAMTFAWLASRTLAGKTGNLPSVTGAGHAVVLGAIYPGRHYP